MAVAWLKEKNGITGTSYTKLADRYDSEKGDATHVRMTVEEYDKLLSTISSYKSKLSAEQTAHKNDVAAEQNRSIQDHNDIVKQANEAINQANARADAAEAEKERQTNLNNNLLRITRERSNAKRGLQPKKKHSGYRFSGKIMQTKTISGHDKKTGAIYTDVWTATLETPYPGIIPIHQIEDKIFDDLKGTDGILNRLYVNYWMFRDSTKLWKGDYLSAIDEKDNPEKKNYLFDYKFMINPKSKLWEIQITTTKSIMALEEMMA